MNPDWYEAFANAPGRLPAEVLAKNGGKQMMAVLSEYHRTERLVSSELAQQQNSLLLALARHAVANSPHFARRMKAANLTPIMLVAPGGLARLTPLTRQALIAAGPKLFCRSIPPPHGRLSSTTTSGSTGEPVTVRRTEFCQLHWLAYTLREHLWHRRDFSGRLAVSRANLTQPVTGPNWGPPCSLVVQTGPAFAWPATRPVDEMVQWLLDIAPNSLLLMPGTLDAVVDGLRDQPAALPGLRDVRTIGETVTSHLREKVRTVLGLEIVDTYSSQECGIMATQCPEAGSYHVSETMLLEVVHADGRPCAPGEFGRLLVTDLLNHATPLIRYEIGDYAEVGTPCSCGRGLPVIRRFLGRERNLVLMPDGSRHWPTVGFHHWGEVYPIRQFQFVQHDRQTLTARLSAKGRPSPAQEERLTTIIQQALGHPFTIRYDWREGPLPRSPGGKFEDFRNEAK